MFFTETFLIFSELEDADIDRVHQMTVRNFYGSTNYTFSIPNIIGQRSKRTQQGGPFSLVYTFLHIDLWKQSNHYLTVLSRYRSISVLTDLPEIL